MPLVVNKERFEEIKQILDANVLKKTAGFLHKIKLLDFLYEATDLKSRGIEKYQAYYNVKIVPVVSERGCESYAMIEKHAELTKKNCQKQVRELKDLLLKCGIEDLGVKPIEGEGIQLLLGNKLNQDYQNELKDANLTKLTPFKPLAKSASDSSPKSKPTTFDVEEEVIKPQVFVIYSRKDAPVVDVICENLKNAGCELWRDTEKLLPGQNFKSVIEQAIRETHAVVLCLSENTVSKEGVIQFEIKTAVDASAEKIEGSTFIIPIKLDDCKPPFSLKDLQWVDFYEDGGWEKVIEALCHRLEVVGINFKVEFESNNEDVLRVYRAKKS